MIKIINFEEWKNEKRLQNENFREIYNLMELFQKNQDALLFGSNSNPAFIWEKRSNIYKKCISYKAKLNYNKIEKLGASYTPNPFCINHSVVYQFIEANRNWINESYSIWNKQYYLCSDFNSNSGYIIDWELSHRYFNFEHTLKKYQQMIHSSLQLLDKGKELLSRYESIIDEEYKTRRLETSYYERELEIQKLGEEVGTEEEYCYVYTLECEICIFYVGIAANPKERLEQHIRGSYSDESHLFKSKFIQKYFNSLKQSIVFEGTRRECKKFERDYISKHNPLGNMTDGGEG